LVGKGVVAEAFDDQYQVVNCLSDRGCGDDFDHAGIGRPASTRSKA
jgi:hypothetical protein